MGRKKDIENNVLLDLIQEYFVSECGSNPDRIKLPLVTKYINAHGYPNYAVESLRRNAEARAYIDTLKQSASQELCAVYKTLNVETFLDTHRTRSSLTKALTDLDSYYKNVADSAMEIQKKYHTLKKQYEKVTNKLIDAENENRELSRTTAPDKALIKDLQAENHALKTLISDCVYPEIANELLVKAGILKKGGSTIIPDKLDEMIITDNSAVTKDASQSGSNVIQGLFDVLED